MKPHPTNFKLRGVLHLAPSVQYQQLCDWANGIAAGGMPESLNGWLDQLRQDAEALLERIAETKEQGQEDGMKKTELDKMARYVVESAKASDESREMVFQVLKDYHPPMEFSDDSARGKILMGSDHPADATNEQLVAFMLHVAINTGEWRRFRRCAEPKCDKPFFFDASTGRGRNPRKYCCSKHQKNHAARLRPR